MMPLKSTVNVADKKSGSLRAVIPKEICEELGLRPGDVLAWDVEKRQGRKVAVVRKLV